ncbi:Protease PrsW [Caloramator mitchellensis]|uniref:Protease PrsW n=1 Tax=Caloramator mitchellensis TaxID=908809 RepID=A0A0R3K0W2_CALMK|nr:PrsW family glutamic-type intramembrane protease [Caloramator mitchellensis]KRQ87028.1 Protease PrsW [Caloramator mitchellensis]
MLKLFAIALAPSIALLIFIYQKDRYDREPANILLTLFLFGFLSTVPVYFVERFLSYFGKGPFYTAFIVAGLTEELFKFIIIYSITFKLVEYNEKLDGIVYSVFTSLGFASAENILYILNQKNFIATGIMRGLFAVPGHMLFAITMGYYLSLARFADDKRPFFLINALLMPILLHGIYDFILFSRIYGYFVIFILFIIYLWRINLNRLNRYVKESRAIYDKDNI